ncbi:MAG TPA: bifunctional alpha,alpha-trehalose-phosphate synthase (UDP-forming)/trehalose-phosphatase [Gemmataceae bacterium]|nr:bifunctional alpha,alpha-trehalose-phosphate synthase (UDP-forming)/trehalose-phosphatase [Gemmataceae bacterium]
MKLVIVSNRLPLSIREEGGRLQFTESPGGLASGLRTYITSPKAAQSEYVWVGWPGGSVREELQAEVVRRCREELSAAPVFLSDQDVEAFYEGFCNNTLWPLFHYFPSLTNYDESCWESYERVNSIFCDAVLKTAGPDDLVWVHDYHFFLLPAMLKRRSPQLRVGFFLHIPFPSFEMFRQLPHAWRCALLKGVLGADVIGFHTHDYTQHFLKCVRRVLGWEHDMGRILLTERTVKVDTFPMGIEFDRFSALASSEQVAHARDELRRPLRDCRIVLSIDRLDYTKGIANRLLAFERFLEENPDWHGKAVLLMVVVPSRMGVESYQKMKTTIDELVGRINGRFGTLEWTPVHYQFRTFPQDQLAPLYAASDVMLVTPIRDGMNLVAKEYVASRPDATGVLILSEMAGAASEFGEALTVNPNDVPGMARAIRTALDLPLDAQKEAMHAMRDRLRRYDVVRWASDFLDALSQRGSQPDRRLLSAEVAARLERDFWKASRRLLLLDYDGTLVPLKATPAQARPDAALLTLLKRLAEKAEVVVVSGRPRAWLTSAFNGDVSMIAEHGAWVRERGGEWMRSGGLKDDWKPPIRQVMEHYVDRLPGAFVEEKEYALAWHYRRADPDLAALRTKELVDHLISLTETADLKVLDGKKVIEVRPSSVSKGAACQIFLGRDCDFILAVGDDATDEDMFRVLPETAYSIRIGLAKSYARFYVYSQSNVRALLEGLAGPSAASLEKSALHWTTHPSLY